MVKEYKLFKTDGKTFFDFRSDPTTRCEGFTLSFLDDGTVVMSGDYGTLCWKRNYHHANPKEEFNRDYGFPNKETNISYFAEKVCQFGIPQQIEEWDKEKAMKQIEEELNKGLEEEKKVEEEEEDDDEEDYEETDEDKRVKKIKDFLEFMSFDDERDMYSQLQDLENELGICYDFWEGHYGTGYSHQFKFMFEILQSVSEQILTAVDDYKRGLAEANKEYE